MKLKFECESGLTQYALRGNSCSEKEFVEWLQSIGGECYTTPQPMFYSSGPLRGMPANVLRSRRVRVKNGRVVVDDG